MKDEKIEERMGRQNELLKEEDHLKIVTFKHLSEKK